MATKSTRPSDRRAGKTVSKQNSKKPQQVVDDQSKSDEEDNGSSQENQQHQQILLNIFRDSFNDVLQSDSFTTVLQEIKQALYEREFNRAFGDPRNLDVYSARWSPTRALCYSRVFEKIQDELDQMLQDTPDEQPNPESVLESSVSTTQDDSEAITIPKDSKQDLSTEIQEKLTINDNDEGENNTHSSQTSNTRPPLRVLAIGGAAAEAVAFASHLSKQPLSQPGHITLLDVGPWGDVVCKLAKHCTTPPTLSKYANAAARAANVPLLSPSSRFSSTFIQRDILDIGASSEELKTVLSLGGNDECKAPLLVTLLFTLNELYTTSGMGKTTKFLRTLTSVVVPGTLLLVVDSPGSYSEASVGKEGAKKKYPMHWLLDHTLRGQEEREKIQKAKLKRAEEERRQGQGADGKVQTEEKKDAVGPEKAAKVDEDGGRGVSWEKLDAYAQDSVWFRMPEGLRYPIALENMRYQMHLYRAV